MKRLFDWLCVHWLRLISLHDTPHSIAGGVAIGIVLGFTPLFSIKTLLAIAIAWLFRCSTVAAAVAVTLHDVTIPLTPFLLRMEYGIGYWILVHPHHWPPKMHLHHPMPWHEWLQFNTFVHVIWPTFIGSLVISIPLAVVAFFITVRLVSAHQRKRARALYGPGVDGPNR